MSRKYYDKLLVGTGTTSKKVASKFGIKMMEKMGWKDGDGLGRDMDGIIDPLQIKRRDENLGMGAELDTVVGKFQWKDQFWDDAYNQAAAKFSANVPKATGKVNHDDSLDSILSINSDDISDVSSFDGEIEIEKSSKTLMSIPKAKKEKKSDKSEKSKSIKKDKKKKSKK